MLESLTIPQIMYDFVADKERKVINHISPSQVGRCMRAHFLHIRHIPTTTPPNPGALLNFQVGFLWEEVMRQALEGSKIPFLYQYKMFDAELDLEGTLDFAPYDPELNEWEVWDSKTESLLASQYRAKKEDSFFDNHPEYVHQLNAYAILMKRQGFNVVRGRFGVIVKDNGLISENRTGFSEDSLISTYNRIIELKDYLDKDELPPCECEGWKVGYCDFGDVDSQEPNAKGKILNTKCCGEELYVPTKDTKQD